MDVNLHTYTNPLKLFFRDRQSVMKSQYQQSQTPKPARQHIRNMPQIMQNQRPFSQKLASLILIIPQSKTNSSAKPVHKIIKLNNDSLDFERTLRKQHLIFSNQQSHNQIHHYSNTGNSFLIFLGFLKAKTAYTCSPAPSIAYCTVHPQFKQNSNSRQVIGHDLKYYNNNQMEYKLNPFSPSETQALMPGPRQNLLFNHVFPPNDYHLHHLYNIVSNIYHEQQTTKEELKTVKEELAMLKDSLKLQEQEKQQQESQRQGKEEETSKLSNPKKKNGKEVECQMPSCGKKYGSVTALRAHMRLKHVTNDDNLDFVPL